jgi:hypothetical protein
MNSPTIPSLITLCGSCMANTKYQTELGAPDPLLLATPLFSTSRERKGKRDNEEVAENVGEN